MKYYSFTIHKTLLPVRIKKNRILISGMTTHDMIFVSRSEITLEKEKSELDNFALDFVKIIERHCDYVLVSGYVSILLGRSRGSEDINILIPKMGREEFFKLADDITDNGFECIVSDDKEEMFSYLTEEKTNIRFARKGEVIPNMEVKFVDNIIHDAAIRDPVSVRLGDEALKISPIELQIVFKEKILGSDKDVEDARHLRVIAKDHMDKDKMRRYEAMIDGIQREE